MRRNPNKVHKFRVAHYEGLKYELNIIRKVKLRREGVWIHLDENSLAMKYYNNKSFYFYRELMPYYK